MKTLIPNKMFKNILFAFVCFLLQNQVAAETRFLALPAPDGVSVTVKVNPLPTFMVTPISTCSSTSVDLTKTLSAFADTGINPVTVFSNNAFADTIDNPANYTPASTETISVKVANAQTGCVSEVKTFTLTVNPLPLLTITSPAPVCSPSTVDLTAAAVTAGSEAGTLSYWTDAAATVSLSSPATAGAGTYYIKLTNTTTSCATIAAVTVTVNALPLLTITSPAPVCSPSTVDITAAAVTAGSEAGTLTYWTDAAATVSLSSPATAGAGTYYIKLTNTTTSCATIAAVTVTVNALPLLTITSPAPVCSPSTVDLTAAAVTAGSEAGTLSYWTDAAATVSLSSPATAGAGTYYIKLTNTTTSCATIAAVTVTVNALPLLTITSPAPVCSPSTVDLTAAAVTAGSEAGTLSYWTDAAATVSLSSPATAGAGTYYIKLTNTTTSCATIAAVTVTVNALPLLTITSPAPVCSPSTVDITAAAVTAGSEAGTLTYWTDAAATVSLSSPATAGAGTYYIKLTNTTTSCATIAAVTVTVNALPLLTITSPAPVCSPSTVDLTAAAVTAGSEAGTLSYWTDATATASLSSPTAAGAGTYYIKLTNTTTSCATIAAVTVTVNALPLLTITSPAPVCSPSTVDLTAAAVTAGSEAGTLTYWTNAAATVSLSSPATAGAGTYYIKLTNTTTSCATIAAVTVTVNALPLLTITSPAPVCSPSTVDLTAAAVTAGSEAGTLSYWTDATATASLSSPTAAGAGTYYIKLTNTTTSCATIAAVTVTVNALPLLTITSPAPVCSPSTVDLTAAAVTAGSEAGTLTYWTDAAATVSLSSPATAGAGTYYIKLTNTTTSCATIAAVTVTVNALPLLTITSPAPVCSPSTVDLTAAAVTAGSEAGTLSYWTDAAATVSLSSPATAGAGTYYIKLTNTTTSCATIAAVTVTVNALPLLTITSPAPVCSPSTVDLTAAAVTAGSEAGTLSYWTDAAATVSLSSPATAGAGTYYIKLTNTTTSCATIAAVTVTVNALPTATISGTTAVCMNATAPQITFTGADGTAPYTFTYNIGGVVGTTTVTTAEGSNSVTVSAPTNIDGTFVYNLVSVQDASSTACQQAQTGSATVTVKALPDAGVIGNKTDYCIGESTSLITTASGGTWSSSAPLAVATVTTGNFFSAKAAGTTTITYTVSANGCTNTSTALFTVHPSPERPVISPASPITINTGESVVLTSSNTTMNNQWYKTGILLPGETTITYTANQSGSYTVKATSEFGCSTTSIPVVVIVQQDTCAQSAKWVQRSIGNNTLYSIAYGNGVYVATGEPQTSGQDDNVFTSTDLVTWTPRKTGVNNTGGFDIVFANNKFVALFKNDTTAVSTDGINWSVSSAPTTGITGPIRSLAANADGSQYLVTSNSGNIFTSTDGLNWTKRTSGTSTHIFGSAFGNGQYVVTESGINGAVDISSDGITWSRRPSALAVAGANIHNTSFAEGLFMTARLNNTFYSSADGITWVIHNTNLPATTSLLAVTAGNGSYAVAGGGDITISSDMQNWTTVMSTGVASLYEIKYLNDVFVAVGTNGTIVYGSPLYVKNKATITHLACYGDSTGSIKDMVIGGGKIPYNYLWNNDSTTINISKLKAGIYNLTVTDTDGCSIETIDTVIQPIAISATTTNVNILCRDSSTGSITINAAGGTGTLEYSNDSGTTYQPLNVFNNLTAGDYDIAVKDANGCITILPVTITEPLAITANISGNATVCQNETTSNITFDATNGTAPYTFTYNINGVVGSTTTVTTTSGNSVTVAAPTTTPGIFVYNLISVQDNGSPTCQQAQNGSATIKVNRYAVPADITASNDTVCMSTPAVLVATSTIGATFNWYADASKTTLLASSNTLTTGNLTTDTTFYVSVQSDTICENQAGTLKAVTVKVNRYAVPADITASNDTVCMSTPATLVATSTIGATFNWYADASKTTLLASSNTLTTGNLTTDTTFYVSVQSDTICENQAGTLKAVTVKVNRYAVPADITASNDTVCMSTPATLVATSTIGATFNWYADASKTTLLASSNTLTTGNLTTDTTFYVSVQSDTICENQAGTLKAVTVKVNRYAVPADITASNDTVCMSTPATLVATSTIGATFNWYADASKTTLLASSNTLTTGNLTTDTTFYVSVQSDTICENPAGSLKAVNVKVNRYAVSADITASNDTVCMSTPATLVATSTIGATFNWYADASKTTLLASSNTLTTGNLTTDTTFYVSVQSDTICENPAGSLKAVNVKVNRYAVSADITASNDTVCMSTPATLVATSTIGATFNWYADASKTTLLASSNTLTTGNLTTDTTFYVSVQSDTICENPAGSLKAVNVKVNRYAVSADITASNDTVCMSTPATLVATSTIGATFNWYADASKTTLLASSNTLTTGNLTTDTTFYVSVQSDTICENPAGSLKAVNVKVNRYAVASDVTANDDTVCMSTPATLVATSTIGATFNWYADASKTTLLASSNTLTTGNLTTDTTFYVSVQSDTICENPAGSLKEVNVKVNRYAVASDVTANDDTVCMSTPATLVATSTIGATFNWYADASKTTLLASSNTLTTGNLTTDTTFYVSVQSDTICENPAGSLKAVNVKVNRYAVASDVTANDDTVCMSTPATLVATSTIGATFNWYADASKTTLLASSNTLTTGNLTTDTTFYVSVQSDTICENQAGSLKEVNVKVNRYAVASDVTANDDTVCMSTPATLVATSTIGATFNWYADASKTTLLASSNTLTTGNLTTDTTFYVSVQSDTICENPAGSLKAVNVKVNRYAVASDVTANDDTVCMSTPATLVATSTIGATFNWYADASKTTLLASSNTLTTGNLTTDTTFYVSVQSDTICENPAGSLKEVNVKVNRYAVASDVTANDDTVCMSTPATLVATSTIGATFNWYADASKTTLLASSNTLTTGNLTTDTTFYVSVQSDTICENPAGSLKAVNVKVNRYAVASDVTANDDTVCMSTPATLVATSTIGATFNWYADASKTTLLASSNTLTTGNLTTDTTFYVSVQSDTICENPAGSLKEVNVKVNRYAVSADITANDDTVCMSTPATLVATSTIGAAFNWYADASKTTLLASSNTLTTGNLTTDTTFYVSVQSDTICENPAGSLKAVNVKVNRYAVASDVTANDDTVCMSTPATLVATSTIGATFNWYADASKTTLLASSNTLTTGNLTTDTTFYVSVQSDTICENPAGSLKEVNVKVNRYAVASDITANDDTVCMSTPATLVATSTIGATFNWYADASKTTLLASSNTLTTGNLTTDTTFYVSVQSDTICENPAGSLKEVNVKVNRYAVASDITANDDTVCMSTPATLVATSTIGATFNWYADASKTTLLASSNTLTTGNLTTDTTFYVSVQSDTICENPAGSLKEVNVKVNRYAVASDVTANDDTVCMSTPATLVATSTIGATFNWYADASKTTLLASSNTLTTGNLTTDTTFYVSVQSDTICENPAGSLKAVNVKVNRYAVASDVIANNDTICTGTAATLTASSPIGTTIKWYATDNPSGTVLFTGSPFVTGNLTVNTTYYVSVQSDTICENPAGSLKEVNVKVNRYAVSADITANDDTVCMSTPATLVATSTIGATFNWYADASKTTLLASSNTLTTGNLTTDTTFYVSVQSDTICENPAGSLKEVNVKVNRYAVASDVTANDDTVCMSTPATLVATSTIGATFNWYADASKTTLLASSNTLTTGNLTTDTTFYVSVQSDTICENPAGSLKEVNVKVNRYAVSADITANDDTVCMSTPATLVATSTIGATFNWYADASKTTLLASSNTLTTGNLTTDTTFYVSVQSDTICENPAGSLKEVNVKVNRYAVSADITANDDTVCMSTPATLVATSTIGAAFNWYADASKTTLLASSNTLTTGNLTTDTTFYVSVQNDTICENQAGTLKAVTVKVNRYAVASDVIANNDTICTGTAATLTASSPIGTTIKWYATDNPSGTVLFTGSPFVTGNLTVNTTYYVSVQNDTICENQAGTLKAVIVKVNRYAVASDVIANNDTVCMSTPATLVATSTIGATFNWYADASKTTLLASSNTLTTGNLTTDTTFYVSVQSDTICENPAGSLKEVNVKVNRYAVASDVTANDDTVCMSTPATLVATSTIGATFNWYADASKTTLLASSNTLTTGNLTTDTTFYVSVQSDTICENPAGSLKEVNVKVNQLLTLTAGSDAIRCQGTSYTVGTATASGYASLLWTTTGTGTLSDAITLTPTYIPAPSETGNIYLILAAQGNPPCSALSDTMRLTLTPAASAMAGSNDSVCEGSIYTLSNTFASNYVSLRWNAVIGDNAAFNDVTLLHALYTPTAADIARGYVRLELIAEGAKPCGTSVDNMDLIIIRKSLVKAGAAKVICSADTVQLTDATAANTASVLWTTSGSGTFANQAVVNTTYIPSAADIAAGSVILTLTGEGVGSCGNAVSTMVVSISKAAIVNAGAAKIICSADTVQLTDATAINIANILWTTSGSGAFANQAVVNTTYIPSAADIAAGSVILTLTGEGAGSCGNAVSTMVVSISKAAIVNAGAAKVICSADTVQLTDATAINTASILWTTSGSGSFANATVLNTAYIPSAADIAAKSVILTLTGEGAGSCGDAVSTTSITIHTAPTANAGNDLASCNQQPVEVVAASASNYSTVYWTHNGSGSFEDSTKLNPTYIPGANESGIVTLVLHASGYGSCTSATSQIVINLHRINVTASASQSPILQGEATTLTGTATDGSGSYSYNWNNIVLINGSHEQPQVATVQLLENVTFMFSATDLKTGCKDTAFVTILVTRVDSLNAVDDYAVTDRETPISIPILNNDMYPSGADLKITIKSDPKHGTVTINPDGTVTYTPSDTTTAQEDSFQYWLCDEKTGLCDTAWVYIKLETVIGSDIKIYSGFSPNGDQRNDTWKILNIEYHLDNEVVIFNRWGDKIKSFKGYNNNDVVWRGEDSNNKRLPDGVYYYIVRIEDRKPVTGWVFIRGND